MEKDVTPAAPVLAPEKTEAEKIWQEYLQACCEVGQLDHAVSQLESQKLQIEKNLEVTQRKVKSLANKHKENQEQGLVPKPTVTPETATEGAAH